jgi:starch synthase
MAAEMVPFAKTGGLADVIAALPKALRAQGHDVRVAIPRYGRIDPERFGLEQALGPYAVPMDEHSDQAVLLQIQLPSPGGEFPVYFIDNEHYYLRDGIYMYEDDADRFIFFCRAALEGVRQLGWRPDVIHCHDWHTAIVPNWLKTIYAEDPFFADTACVYTIHNLAYQGIFGYRVLEIAGVDEYGFLADVDLPHLNDAVDFMGRGIYYADIVTTVSETYAREILTPEFGEGLDALLRDRRDRLFGVLNGIDTELYDPATDALLPSHYDIEGMAGKQDCKRELQQQAGLAVDARMPVIGMISRLADQKGLDLIDMIVEPLLNSHDAQIVIVGTGEQRYHERLKGLRARFPERLALFLTFNEALTHKVYAGSDMFLMPSRFEPCGLGQMVALRYGTIPVVRATGGLADTVHDYDRSSDVGNGFVFDEYNSYELYGAIVRALDAYRDPAAWLQIQSNAMAADHSWNASARRYAELFRMAQQQRRAARKNPRAPSG